MSRNILIFHVLFITQVSVKDAAIASPFIEPKGFLTKKIDETHIELPKYIKINHSN